LVPSVSLQSILVADTKRHLFSATSDGFSNGQRPAQDVQLPFEIHVLNIVDGATALLGSLSELTEAPDAKAEVISVLSQQENVVNVLVMFDGLKNGGPREPLVAQVMITGQQ
jgi:hypothetical protein